MTGVRRTARGRSGSDRGAPASTEAVTASEVDVTLPSDGGVLASQVPPSDVIGGDDDNQSRAPRPPADAHAMVQRRPLPQDISSRIEASIQVGRYAIGMRLPPERALATRMGTSRNVLREALRILETRGVVEIRHGIGAFIVANPSSGPSQIPIEIRLQRATLPVDEVMVVRRAIECAVVEVAARARDEADLEQLRELLDQASHCVEERDADRNIELDIRFHEFLGVCTHNRLLADIQAELTRATSSVRSIASDTYDAVRAAIVFHGEIIDALTRRDAEAARAAMVMHLLDARERLVAALIGGEERDGPNSCDTNPIAQGDHW